MKRLLAALAVAAATALAGGDALAAVIRAPMVRYDLRVLPNGLKVYSVVDGSRPEVAVQVWYQVGSKDDPPGRAGFAHLFEHLMFKGSPGLPAEYMDQFTESVGGSSNASTTEDYTAYEDLVPAAALERTLWAEAVRMNALTVSAADFKAERAVVEQEVREAFADDPYGRLFMQDIPQASFASPAFRQSPAGTIHDLEASTLADVAAFKTLFYRPDNAILIVVGDIDPAQLRAWVDRYFGALRAPDAPAPRIVAREPPRQAPQRVAVSAHGAPAPAVVLSYAGPTAASSDAVALRLLDQVLTGGDEARGVAALVARRRLATDVFSDVDLRREAGLIYFGAILAPGHGAREGEAALRRELARLRRREVSRAELDTAKNQLLAKTLAGRETLDGLAGEIGQAAVVGGNAAQVNATVAALQAVTPADVRRVARRYVVDSRRVTIRYGAAGHGPQERTAPTAAPAPLRTLTPHAPGPMVEPPPPPADAPLAPPTICAPHTVTQTLPNGLRLVVARSGALPLATAVMSFPSGGQPDGLADLAASLALRGAGGHSGRQIAATLSALGLKLSTQVDRDSTTFELTGLAASLPQGLALLADVVRRPTYPAAELRKALREPSAQDGEAAADDLADMAIDALVFGRASSRHPSQPSPRRADLVRQHDRAWRPDQAMLVVTGAVDPLAVSTVVQAAFGARGDPPDAPPAPAAPQTQPKPHVVAIDLPGAEVAEVAVAELAGAPSATERAALEIANTALGGGASSRLSREIRIQRGLSYDVSSELDLQRHGGLFTVRTETRNAAAPEVASLIVEELRRLSLRPLSPAELAARKAALLGDYGRRVETTVELAELLTQEGSDGAGPAALSAHLSTIRDASAAEVRRAAARLADAAGVQILIIGDVSRFRAELARRFPNAEVIGQDQLAHGWPPAAG